MMNAQPTTNLLDLTLEALGDWLSVNPAFPKHAKTLFSAIHKKGTVDFSSIDTLPMAMKAFLAEHAKVEAPTIAHSYVAQDGTHKMLMRLSDGNSIEAVFIPELNRGTLCVSSQVGCALNCSFCSTGKQGFNRNLTTAEIIGQLWLAARQHEITNIVFMGMGEPLLNLDAVVPAIDIMLNDHAYGLSKYRVTVSSSGLVPQLKELRERTDVALAISLHAARDELRDVLVPINKKYPIATLLDTCHQYYGQDAKRPILYEYVMLAGVNDTDEDAHQLGALLKGTSSKVNLIPFNPFVGSGYARSSSQRIDEFWHILVSYGILTMMRKTRGDDIAAACGQLNGEFQDRTRRRIVFEAREQLG